MVVLLPSLELPVFLSSVVVPDTIIILFSLVPGNTVSISALSLPEEKTQITFLSKAN